MNCLVCGAPEVEPYFEDARRPYRRCPACGLICVPREHWPSAEAERARYDQHRNDPSDEGYRRFLSRTRDAVVSRIAPPASGLDFGSGPGPTLSIMLRDAGYDVSLYDVFYAPDEAVLRRRYDFVTCTEVIEHLHDPVSVVRRLAGQLVTGGWLVVQTQLAPDLDAFASWRYRRDPTHVAFYSEEALRVLARRAGCGLERAAADVFAFSKPRVP